MCPDALIRTRRQLSKRVQYLTKDCRVELCILEEALEGRNRNLLKELHLLLRVVL